MTTQTATPGAPKAPAVALDILPIVASEPAAEYSYGDMIVPVGDSTDLDIPSLIAQGVEDTITPTSWTKWGRVNRNAEAEAWHFYCTDAKFETLLRDPLKLIETKATHAVEVNVSTFEEDPLPVALAGLFRRRCVSRIWQEAGVRVAVDLNVSGITRELVLEGVPKTHGLYATKYQKRDLDGEDMGIDQLLDDFLLADDHVDENVPFDFIVYGGGKKVIDLCDEYGWIHVPSVSARRV